MNTRTLLIGAIILFAVLLAGAGIYVFLSSSKTAGENGAAPSASGVPVSIKVFRVQNGSFLMQGDNLARVEVWAIKNGQQNMLGNATQQSGSGQNGTGETWTMPVPAGAKGASSVFAKGYDAGGNSVRIDLLPTELRSL